MKTAPTLSGSNSITRRHFLAGASVAALAGIRIVPSHVLGAGDQPAPSEQLNLAGVGIGGVGHGQLQELAKAGFRIAAMKITNDEKANLYLAADYRHGWK